MDEVSRNRSCPRHASSNLLFNFPVVHFFTREPEAGEAACEKPPAMWVAAGSADVQAIDHTLDPFGVTGELNRAVVLCR